MSQPGNTPLPRRDALPPSRGRPFYITGEAAQDLCRLTGLELATDGKFIDVSRLPWWDYWRVLWAWVGGNYYAWCKPFPERVCLGCLEGWPLSSNEHGYPIHLARDTIGGIVGCYK
jgi:hypothetical protein